MRKDTKDTLAKIFGFYRAGNPEHTRPYVVSMKAVDAKKPSDIDMHDVVKNFNKPSDRLSSNSWLFHQSLVGPTRRRQDF